MSWLESLSEWITANSTILWWLSAASLALFLVTPVIVAWLVTKLPTDYFSQKHRRALASFDRRPALRLTLLIAKSAIGVVLLIAGLVMLLAPGQGLLTIVAGLILLEFPGKYRLERWLVTRRHVWRSINWLRKRAGRPELKSPR
jgi:hypothetical protein